MIILHPRLEKPTRTGRVTHSRANPRLPAAHQGAAGASRKLKILTENQTFQIHSPVALVAQGVRESGEGAAILSVLVRIPRGPLGTQGSVWESFILGQIFLLLKISARPRGTMMGN